MEVMNYPQQAGTKAIISKIMIVSSVESTLYLVFRAFQRFTSHLDVPATLPEALSQHGDHVFVVVQQLLHQFTETGLDILILDLDTEGRTSA